MGEHSDQNLLPVSGAAGSIGFSISVTQNSNPQFRKFIKSSLLFHSLPEGESNSVKE